MCCKQEDNTKKFELKGNPMIVDKFTADPAPMVYDGVLYLYVGHDEYYEGQNSASGGKEFNITEWLCYSTTDMKTWTDHGSVLKPTDFKWAVGEAWASRLLRKMENSIIIPLYRPENHTTVKRLEWLLLIIR